MNQSNPLDRQVGGGHYKGVRQQPIQYAEIHKLSASEFSILRYILRWRTKNGLEDIAKVEHYLQLMIQMAENGEIPPIEGVYTHPLIKFLSQYPFISQVEFLILSRVMRWRYSEPWEGGRLERGPHVEYLKKSLELIPAIRQIYEKEKL